MRDILLVLLFLTGMTGQIHAQVNQSVNPVTEDILKARTKQVNQFIRRFNSEESPEGKKYSKDNPHYHQAAQRLKYMPYLFDSQTDNFTEKTRQAFIKDVVKDETPEFLDFHKANWFAEVNASFTYKGSQKDALLFLKIEKERKGYKWVISNVYFSPFTRKFDTDTAFSDYFMHPMSHEVDFMNLKEVFADPKKVEYYAADNYQPDYLTLFFYELKNENLQFRYVKQVKFHFLQLEDWYFELSYIERQGKNAGWMITNLLEVSEKSKEELAEIIQLKR